MADLAECPKLPDGLRELARPCLDLVKQPHVLNRDHRLIGEGRDELDLLVRERPHRTARRTTTPIGLRSRSSGTHRTVR